MRAHCGLGNDVASEFFVGAQIILHGLTASIVSEHACDDVP